MICFGLSNAIAKKPVKEVGGIKAALFRNIFLSLFMFILLFLLHDFSLFSWNYLFIAIGISIIGYFPLLFYFKSLEYGKVGVVAPIANSSIFFTVIFSILFFEESLTLNQIIAIIIILLGVILISINFKDIKNSQLFFIKSGIPFALISCFGWGLVFALFKIPINALGPILTGLIVELGVLFSAIIHLKFKKQTFELKKKQKHLYKYFIAMGLLGMVGNLAYFNALNIAKVSIVSAITFSNPLIATIYGRVVYKEHLKKQQWAALFLILFGVVIMSLN